MSTANEREEALRRQVELAVLGGYEHELEVLTRLEEAAKHEVMDSAATARLLEYARGLLAARRQEEARWTEPTTNDAIASAFEELYEKRHILAVENVEWPLSEVWAQITSAAQGDYDPPRGATFFHAEDVPRAVQGEGLLLYYGALSDDGTRQDVGSPAIAREVLATLERHGVAAEWDGSLESPIRILPFPWRNRRCTMAPRKSVSVDDRPPSRVEEPIHRQVLEQLVRDDGIARDVATAALESFICRTVREHLGVSCDLEAKYDPESGWVEVFRGIKVVEALTEGPEAEDQRTYAELRKHGLEVEVGDDLVFQLFYLKEHAENAFFQDARWGSITRVRTVGRGIEGLTPSVLRERVLEELRRPGPGK
ncbi:DUF6891 domain-containing protein [Pyxidicoccus sp. 3LG]